MKQEVYSYHRDVEDVHWWFVGRRRILMPLINECMRGHEKDLIVDVGCGTGGTVAALSPHYDCIGMDHSEQAIAMARQKYPGANFIAGNVQGDLRDLRERTALYCLMDVLEHIEDDRGFLAEVAAATRSGGHILITVPARTVLWSGHDVAANHVRRYELDTLVALWQGMGLTPRVVSFFNARLYPAIRVARFIGRHMGLFSGKDGRDLVVPAAPINAFLTGIFAGEAPRIAALLDDSAAKPYAWGSSLVAVLEKAESE